MRTIVCCFLLVFLAAEGPEPPIADARLPVSTLVREDVFAGWMDQDMERFARAEKNLDQLIEERPRSKAESLAWKGGTKLYRAVLANEAGNQEEYDKYYQEASELFAEAKQLNANNAAVCAVVGGSLGLFGDRLHEEHRADAFGQAWDNYSILWTMQSRVLERLPLHIKGELLAGLTQSAERTGRTEEYNKYLDKMIEVLPDSHYEEIALEWKADPEVAKTGTIMCQYCHDDGKLEERMARLENLGKD
ncbi:MAG: hypothetical protein DWQ37_05705 [Planctomycetota bacterium]|nr:MAG: hypothetical protein DWQ37_05705 [Planctomycetota bacterium]